MKMKSIIATILFTMSFLPRVRAADDLAPIQPYLDQNTLLVVRFDTTAIDPAAFGRWLGEGIKANVIPIQSRQAQSLRIEKLLADTTKWLSDFRKAGGSTVFLGANFSQSGVDEVFMLTPLQPNADSKIIEPLLARFFGGGVTRVMNGAVVATNPKMLEKFQQLKPTSRPELAQAFADAGNAPLRAAVIPSDDLRKVFEALSPQLPPQLGGGPITALSRGMKTATIALDPRANGTFQFHIQASDPSAAKDIVGIISAATEFLRKEAVQNKLELLVTLMDQVKPQVNPQVSGSQILIDLSPQAAQQSAGGVVSFFLRAKIVSQRVIDASQVHQLLLASINYSTQHQQQWPENLDQLVKAQDLNPSLLVNAVDPSGKAGYTYVKPQLPFGKVDPQTIVLYDAHDVWEDGINVGYADGHVEWIANDDEFKKQLAASSQPVK